MSGRTLQLIPEAEEESYLPRVLPAGWVRAPWITPAFDCVSMTNEMRGLRVFVSVSIEEDGHRWMHVSASCKVRCPSWEEMDAVKRIFIGDQRWAYQVHPPRAEHYSGIPVREGGMPRAGTVLHLWSPLEGEPRLPNFLRARGGTL